MELRNPMRGIVLTSLGIALTVCLTAGTLNAGLLYVEDIQLTLAAPVFYQGGTPGNFQLNSVDIIADNGIVRVGGAAGFDYGITGTINVTSSALVNENSDSGLASGDFAGGSTLTITGDLVDLSDSSVKANGVLLLEAVMDAGTWVLEEWIAQDVRGNTDFNVTGGVLSSGVDVGGGDTLRIDDFQGTFSFITGMGPFVGVDPASFGETDISGFISNVQIVAVPEPSTLMLLSVAGIAVLRKSKRK